MRGARGTVVGRVVGVWRYPVKSTTGEELNATAIGNGGLLGDRAFALVDAETGKGASAKNLPTQAAYVEPPDEGRPPPPVRITLTIGQTLTTDQAGADRRLTEAVGRPVRLARSGSAAATAEGYWPDHDWLPQRDEVFEFPSRRGRSSTAPRST